MALPAGNRTPKRGSGTAARRSGIERPEMRRKATEKEIEWMNHYGDKYGIERENEGHQPFIISSGNANFISKKGTPKLISLQDAIKGNAVQGLSEHNTNFSLVPQQDQLGEKFKKVWRRRPKIKTTWIKDRKDSWKSRTSVQQGGTAMIATGQAAEYMHESGEDKEGLARWTWMKFEGRSDIKTAVIQIYRPIYNVTGPGSVYQQQQSRIKDGTEVLKKYDDDLLDLVDTLMEEGFRIIVMGDFNMDVRNGRKRLINELKKRGISERITQRYGTENAKNTYRWGKDPIDGMFASDELEMVRGGHRGGDPSLSDHKFIWGEFTYDSVLGKERGKAYSPDMRKLQLKYKKVTKKFIQLLVKYMNDHKMLKRAEELWDSIEGEEMDDEQYNKYETLDKEFEQAVQYADNGCRKLFPHDIEFSPEVKQAIGNLTIWKEIEKKIKRKQKIKGRWIKNMKKKYKVDNHYDLTISESECTKQVTKAWEQFNEVRKNAPELRESFLDSLIREAEKMKSDEGRKKVKELRAIKETERSREAHARIKSASGKFKSQGVRYVHKEMEDGSIVTITDPIEIEQEIIKANQAKLHQCNERTPLRQQPLVDLLTKFDYDVWEQFLQGEIPIPEGLEKGTEEYLKVYHGIDNNDFDILHTTKGLKKAWSKAKEKTSAAPGPIHYGTMKTMKWCLPLAKMQTIMANIPLKTSRTPSSWSKDVEAMLMKKKDDFRPEKLRRIGLLSCAFNMNNKHIGREAMKNAERLELLAEEQFGSRKNLSAEKHALNKRLMLDIMRVTKTPGVLTANDAKSCYDRILHFATYTALRRAGVPKQAVISMVHTLRTMQHTVRTGYGDSTTHYGGEEDDDQHGATQGNGAGPAIWALVSSPLLDILRKEGYGAKLVSPIRKEFFHLCGFAFVDDTDTIQTGEGGDNTAEIMIEAQEEMDLWECLIRATGGAIEGEKSDFTVINWEWKGGKARYEKMSEDNILTCLNSEGIRDNLKQLPTNVARRTLGVWQSADGQENTQKEKMIEKAEAWCNRIFKSSLSKGDIAMGIKTALYPSLTYGLMATALSKEQCDEVFKPIRCKMLPKMKICRTAPAEIVHGPIAYGGMEFKHIYTLQGIAHTKILIEEGDENSTTGKLLRNLIEQHTVEVGLPGEFTSWNYKAIEPIMTNTWLKNTMEYMDRDHITMDTDNPKLCKWSEEDTFIMEDAIQAGIRGHQLQAMNRCRLYMQVVTRSDLSSGGGDEILKEVIDVEKGTESMSSKEYKWPYQTRPTVADRNEWKRAILSMYGVDSRHKRWRRNCGRWTERANNSTRWLYVHEEDRLYEREGDHWNIWVSSIARRRRNGTFSKTTRTTQQRPGNNTSVAKVRVRNQRSAKVVGYGTAARGTNEGDRATSNVLESEVRHIDENLLWAIEQLDLPTDNGDKIAQMIRDGKGRCMSDGSLKNSYGSSAFTFLTNDDECGISGRNVVPGMNVDQSSYRSELCGILGNILILNAICRCHGITEDHQVLVGCDSESALWNSFGTAPITTKMASHDLVAAIRHQIRISPLDLKSKWVKGHQDDRGGILDSWALANIECDHQAERIWKQKEREGGERRPGVEGRMPGEKWVCFTKQGKMSSEIDQQLYDTSMRNDMIQYWEKKERIEEGSGEEVDWVSHSRAMKNFGPRRIWVSKHCSGWAGSGKMMLRWKFRDNAKCPRCEEAEDTHHVVQCQDIGNLNSFKDATQPLKQWLTDTTSPRIKSAVMTHIKAYQRNVLVGGFRTTDSQTRSVSEDQDNLGRRSFGEGFLTTGWRDLQMKYHGGPDSVEKSQRWVTQLIQQIWEVSWRMWEARNNLIHNDASVRSELFLDNINAMIEVLHEEGTSSQVLFPSEQKFFRNPVERVLQQDERSKILWIEVAERYLDADRLLERENTSQGRFQQWLNQARQSNNEVQFTASATNRSTDATTPNNEYPHTPRNRTLTPIELIQQQIQWNPRPSNNTTSLKRSQPARRQLNASEPTLAQQTITEWGRPSKRQRIGPDIIKTDSPSRLDINKRELPTPEVNITQKRQRPLRGRSPISEINTQMRKKRTRPLKSTREDDSVSTTNHTTKQIKKRTRPERAGTHKTNQITNQSKKKKARTKTTIKARINERPLRGRSPSQETRIIQRPLRGRSSPYTSRRLPLRGQPVTRRVLTRKRNRTEESTSKAPSITGNASKPSPGRPTKRRRQLGDDGSTQGEHDALRPTESDEPTNASNVRPLRGRSQQRHQYQQDHLIIEGAPRQSVNDTSSVERSRDDIISD